MKTLSKIGIIAFSLGLLFIGVGTVNAQQVRKERREYRKDIKDARRDYRKEVRSGESRQEARGDLMQKRRSARHDHRQGLRYRVYYRNGRRYVTRY